MNLKKLLKKLFHRKLKVRLLEEKYRIEEAFSMGGKTYWWFSNQFDVPTQRGLAALAIYHEMNMNCDREYLIKVTQAYDKILSDPKKINISAIVQINMYMKERLELCTLPDFVYKLASVVFFDDSESPYGYDFEYNEKKIARWKQDPGTLDFFLRTQLKDLIPSLRQPGANSKMYFQVAKQIDRIHQENLTEILSEKQ